MIPGFELGLKDMQPGGRRRIIVPPELGPPTGPATFFSAKQWEVFDIELLEVKSCSSSSRGRHGVQFVTCERSVRASALEFVHKDATAATERRASLFVARQPCSDSTRTGPPAMTMARERGPSTAAARARRATVDARRRRRASDVTFSKLPPAARRVVTIPAPALARALGRRAIAIAMPSWAAKRRKTAQSERWSGASLTSALPKPKRAALGGGGALGAGALGGGGAMLDLGTGGFGRASTPRARRGRGRGGGGGGGTGAHAASMYAVGDDGEYVNPNAAYAYDADAYDDDETTRWCTMPANEGAAQGSFVDQALAAAAKAEYERHGREIKITTLSAADLRKRPGHGKTAPVLETEGMFQQSKPRARARRRETSIKSRRCYTKPR